MARTLICLAIVLCSSVYSGPAPVDTDNDGIPDAVERRLAMDPNRPDKLDLVHDDKAKGQGDKSCGADLRDAYDFTRVYFGNVARDRYVWRVDFTKPPLPNQTIAFIIYVDADNDPNTGRTGGFKGTDIMIRPDQVQAFGPMREALPNGVSAVVGNTQYFVVDVPLHQEAGHSVFRCRLLSQHRSADRGRDSDTSGSFTVTGQGNSDREPVYVPKGHPLHVPAQEFRNLGARVFFGPDSSPRVHVTWITSWPTRSILEYGPTSQCEHKAEGERSVRNHRIVLDCLEPNSKYFYRLLGYGRLGQPVRCEPKRFDTTRPPRKPCAAARATLPLTVENPTDKPLRSWPVTAGIPFPAGALTSVDKVRLVGPDGKEAPLQAAATARWLDRSIKWLLLDLQVSLGPSETKLWTLEYGEQVARQPFETPLCVNSWCDRVTVLTGPLKLQFGDSKFGLLDRVWLDVNGDQRFGDDERVTDSGETAVVDDSGERFTSAASPADKVMVEESGPMRVAVKIAGRHASPKGRRLFHYTVRVHAYAGQSFVRVFHTFANDATDEVFTKIRSLSLTTGLNLRGPRRCVVGADSKVECPAASTRVRLFQNFDDRFSLVAGDKPVEGTRSLGWMQLRDDRWGLTVAVRNFWKLYPKALTCEGGRIQVEICPALAANEYASRKADEDKLYYYMLNGRYKLKCGVSKTHELLYHFHRADPDANIEATAAALNSPPIPVAPAKWYCESMAFGEITPATDGEFPEYEAMVKRIAAAFHRDREAKREYGMLNYGDYYGERLWNWGNIEYDTQHGFLMQFARTANPDYYRLAEAAARHNVDVDHVHFHARPDYVGRVYTHCICHVGDYYPRGFKPPAIPSGHYGAGHAWNRGNLEYCFLSGYRRAGEVAMQLSDMQAWRETLNHRVRGAERATAWPLFAAVAAYRSTYDEYYLNAARLMVDAVAEQQTDAGHWNIPAGYSKVVPMPIGGYAWCAGLLLSALEDYYDETGDARAAKAAAKAGEWLLRTEWIPDRHGFRATSCDSFNASTPPGCECCRVPPGLGFVYDVTGERRFMDVALKGFSHAIRARRGGGKGGSTALCTTPHFIHDLKRLGITRLPDLTVPRRAGVWLPHALALLPGEPAVIQGAVTAGSKAKTFTVRVTALPQGWKASPMSQTVEPKSTGSEEHFQIRLDTPDKEPLSGEGTVGLAVVSQGLDVRRAVAVVSIKRIKYGDKTGLIAGKEDFLGPALTKAGVAFEPIADVGADLTQFGSIWLGTQAHTINAAKISTRPLALHRYVRSGGVLVISQMNDGGWDSGYLPCRIELSEDNSDSASILAPKHPVFCAPNRVTNVAGMQAFDSIAFCGQGAKVLLADTRGTPAIVEITCGHGAVFVFEPSVERYYTGALPAATQSRQKQYCALFENMVAYVRQIVRLRP